MPNIFELIREKHPDGVSYMAISACVLPVSNIKWTNTEDRLYKYIDISAVDAAMHNITETQMVCSKDAPSSAQRILFTDDTIISRTRPLLRCYTLIPDIYDGCICSSGFCVLRPNTEIVLPRYLLHCVSTETFFNYIGRVQTGTVYPTVSDFNIRAYVIPVPLIEIQHEIVSILDKFDTYCNDMTTGLAGELKMRQKQHQYWSKELVMSGNIKMIELGKLCHINKGTQMNKSDYKDGPYPVYNMGSKPSGTHSAYNRDTPTIVIAGHGNSCGFVNWVDEPFWAGGGCYYLDEFTPGLNDKYLYYAMKVMEKSLMEMGSHGPIRNLYPRTIARLQVPVPVSASDTGALDVTRQQYICDILDKMSELEHELEHELEMRQKQYAYYRDNLLALPEKGGGKNV